MSNSPIKHSSSNPETITPKIRSKRSIMGQQSLIKPDHFTYYANDFFSAFRKACELHQCENIPSPINVDDDKKLIHLDDNPYKIYVGFKKVDGMNELDKIMFKNNDIECKIIFALKDWIDPYKFISTLKFEYCDLTENHITLLADILRTHSSINELSLNGNTLKEQNHFLVLRETQLFSLSLKFCGINTEGIRGIAQELGTPTGNPLLHLNLASNFLGEGIIYVAQFLRINRNLLSLNLADNKLRNKECITLIQPLEKFELDYDDILVRRRIKFEFLKKNFDKGETRNNGEVARKSSKNTKKTSQEKSSSAGGITKNSIRYSVIAELPYHPFVQDSYEEETEFYCKGNDVLANLNLSYNRITKEGIRRILDMLIYQRNNYDYANDKGISRISIEGNVLDANARAYCDEIEKLLTIRKHSFASKQSNGHNSIKRNSSFT